MNPCYADPSLRVVFLVKRFWPDVGGVEKYILELGRALRGLGHQIHVVTGDPTGTRPRRQSHAGLVIHRFPSRRSPWRAAWRLRSLTGLFRDAEVVHVSDVEMLEYYHRRIEPRVGPRAVFLTRHGMSLREPVTAEERERHRWAREYAAGMLDDGTFIQRRYGQAPDLVPDPGLDPPAAAIVQQPPPPADKAVFIGRLEPDTGMDIYLDALADLRERHGLELALTVFGDGSRRMPLQERAQRDQLPVDWRPPAPDAQDRLFDGSLAFVSGRMAIFEAMARRRPVVAAYVDPLKRDYICGEWFSPFLVAGANGRDLADRLAHLLADPAYRRSLVDRAFEQVRRLDWRRTAQAYLSVWSGAGAPASMPTPRSSLPAAQRGTENGLADRPCVSMG